MKLKIYPEYCNSNSYNDGYMIHGGEILKQADKSAAIAIEEYLHQMHLSGKCSGFLTPLTVGVNNCQFYSGPKLGDIIEFKTKVLTPNTNHKIDCTVTVFNTLTSTLLFKGMFSFCTFRFDEKIDNYILEKHGLNK